MAAIHLRMEQRHLVSVRLYSLMTVRLEQAAEGFAERVRGVPSLVAATAELGESDGAVMVLFDSEQDEALTLASDPTALRAHELEFEVGEGPAVDAVRARAQIAARGEQMLDRWRLYGPEVRGLDVHAVAAAPLQPGAACIGTLTLLNPVATPTDPSIAVLGEALAYSLIEAFHVDPEGFAPADCGHRLAVYEAAGMIAARERCSPHDALALIRARAFAEGTDAHAVADAILHGTDASF